MVKGSQSIQEQIVEVQNQLENVRKRIPKHDIPAALMFELDELEEELVNLKAKAKKPVSLADQIEQAENQLAEARARVPKHDIPSFLMAEIDELEEELEKLQALRDGNA